MKHPILFLSNLHSKEIIHPHFLHSSGRGNEHEEQNIKQMLPKKRRVLCSYLRFTLLPKAASDSTVQNAKGPILCRAHKSTGCLLFKELWLLQLQMLNSEVIVIILHYGKTQKSKFKSPYLFDLNLNFGSQHALNK